MTTRVSAVLTGMAAISVAWVLVVAPSAAAFTTRDMLGRDVTLAAPPQRIVSLVPSVTEILYALNAESLLVGVTDFCDFPPEARRQPKVGGMVAPSLGRRPARARPAARAAAPPRPPGPGPGPRRARTGRRPAAARRRGARAGRRPSAAAGGRRRRGGWGGAALRGTRGVPAAWRGC